MKITELLSESILKREEELNEMPVANYQYLGPQDKGHSFGGKSGAIDRKLVNHPKNIEKVFKFFEKTKYDFNIYPANVPGTNKFREYGVVDENFIRQNFKEYADAILQNVSEEHITVVYVGNTGAELVMLTPWMMGHRFGHAVAASLSKIPEWEKSADEFFRITNRLLANYYNINIPSGYGTSRGYNYQLDEHYSALFNAIGTQRSSRNNQIKRPYEFIYELFAQYLKNGEITLNPLPISVGFGKKNWGRSSRTLNIDTNMHDEGDRSEVVSELKYHLENEFDRVLSRCAGKIFVM